MGTRPGDGMNTRKVPTYVIDLDKPESERWSEVIASETENARRLVQEAAAEFARVPEAARWLFAHAYRLLGGLYHDDIKAWATGLGVTVGTATLLNCAYEFSHVRFPKIFGCTAGIRWVDGLGLVHARTLDWPLPS